MKSIFDHQWRTPLSQTEQLERMAPSAEELYEDLIATIHEPLVVLSANLEVVDANPAFYRAFQVSPQETEGRPLYQLGNGQWDIPQLRQLLENILPQRTEFRDFEVDHDFESIGRKIMLLNAGQLHCHPLGASLILLTIEDITERRRIEGEAIRARLGPGSPQRLMDHLFSGAAHQLNNPLGIILGYTELALQADLPENVRDYLKTIESATLRASQVVKNLLSWSAAGALTSAGIGVSIILERLAVQASQDLRLGAVPVSLQIAPDLPQISAEPYQLLEALLNIVINAQQAIIQSRQDGEILIQANRSGDRVRISISDNGPGILPEHLSRIFDSYFTTKAAEGGAGLGLSFSQGAIQQMGGELWVESVAGEGTTFHVELPLSPVIETEPSAGGGRRERDISWQRILVVNNEVDFRRLVALVCEPAGRLVDRAKDGKQAWEMIQRQSYSRIILNIHMPLMNGPELYQCIKEENPQLAQRCVFMTGDTHSPEVKEFLAATGNPVLLKPFRVADLRQLLLNP